MGPLILDISITEKFMETESRPVDGDRGEGGLIASCL
jgi:hypothetical protein